MADDKATMVNGQVTDAITQTNVQVLGEAPAMAMGSLYQTIGNSVAMAAANAVYAQQQANVTYQTATTMAVKTLLSNSNMSMPKQKNVEPLSDEHIDTLIITLENQIDSLKEIKAQKASDKTSKKGGKVGKK